jgi:hypothetical protein
MQVFIISVIQHPILRVILNSEDTEACHGVEAAVMRQYPKKERYHAEHGVIAWL